MERYNRILQDEQYNNLLVKLDTLESDRKFCRHGMEHLLSVCRIAYIIVLENGLNISKDTVYAAGLLHDIGRVSEYEKGLPHDEESARIAKEVLARCGYGDDEAKIICDAILSHRNKDNVKNAGNPAYNKITAKTLNESNAVNTATELNILKANASYTHEADISLQLSVLLKNADRLSRNCFCCGSYNECKWEENQKNKGVI